MISNDLNVFDIVHLNSLLHTVQRELRESAITFKLLGETLEALHVESCIPLEIRNDYRTLACDLDQITKKITITRDKYEEVYQPLDLLSVEATPKLSAQALALTYQKIQDINALEHRLILDITQAKKAVQSKSIQDLVDWSMPFDVDLSVEIEGLPENFNYTNLDSDNLTISANYFHIHHGDSASGSQNYNWNTFEHKPGHPLEHCHFGYLLHCLIDHSHFPWWLLHRIVAVHSKVQFSDSSIIAKLKSC